MMNVNSEKLKRYGEFTMYYKNKYNGKVPIIHFLQLPNTEKRNWKS